MPIEVTENWPRKMSFRPPWDASREFVVTGTTNPAEALTATDYRTGARVPQQNEHHPDAGALTALGPQITGGEGPMHFVVYVGYIYDVGKEDPVDANPLLKPVDYWWENVE